MKLKINLIISKGHIIQGEPGKIIKDLTHDISFAERLESGNNTQIYLASFY